LYKYNKLNTGAANLFKHLAVTCCTGEHCGMASTKVRKLLFITAIILLALAGTLHFWFSRNAARYLETIVSEQSKGRLQLKVKGFSYNLFTGFIEVKTGSLRSLDSLTQPATYNIRLDKLTLHMQSFWPLLVQRKLLLDSVLVQRPHITIYRWRKDPLLDARREEVSLPSELGRIYKSLLEGLNAMELKRIGVTGATVVLYDKMKQGSPPIALRGIDFSLHYRGRPDSRNADARLRIPGQVVDLPNGRYRLSFRQIELEQFGRRLQLDSCTIVTRNKKGTSTNFNLYFKNVLLSGMDFEALYRYNLIRADSVWCTSPLFEIQVQQNAKAKTTGSKPVPKEFVSHVLDDMGADMDLRFIGFSDAGFRIKLAGQKQRTISNARHDDFLLRNLRIKSDSSQPFSIGQFNMMVRGYELYNEDSSAVFRFDSVEFRNNRVMLRQFNATTLPGRKGLHNERRYAIPYLELEDLDWYALAFEERLQAKNVYLSNPQIYFRALKPKTGRSRQSLFDILESAGGLLSLETVNVRNGQLHLVPDDQTDIKLSNANLVLHTPSLLAARSEAGIKNSVEELSFDEGTVQQKDALIKLQGVSYQKEGGLNARQLLLRNGGMRAELSNVGLGNAFIDKNKNSISLQGLRWQRGTVHLQAIGKPAPKKNETGNLLEISGLQGSNTKLVVESENMQLTTFINSVGATAVSRSAKGKMAITNLQLNGGKLAAALQETNLSASGYALSPTGAFSVNDVDVHQQNSTDTLQLTSPSVKATVNLDDLLQNKMRLDMLQLDRPRFLLHKKAVAASRRFDLGPILIKEALLIKPQVDIALYRNDSVTKLMLQPAQEGKLQVRNIYLSPDSMALGTVQLHAGAVAFEQGNGRRTGTDTGRLYLEASGLQKTSVGGKPLWAGTVDSVVLLRPLPLTVGKQATKISTTQISAGHIKLPGDGNLAQMWHLPNAWLRSGSGSLRDSNTAVSWIAARYDAADNRLSFDSLAVVPLASREAFIAGRPYQTDYITFHSGPLQLNGFNRQRFEEEGFLEARAIQVQRPQITIYRDKRPPFPGGINKPLPTNKLQQLSFPVQIGQVQLLNGLVAYTELNDKTNEEGIITLTNLNATIANIRNRNIGPTDSLQLRMDALLLDSAQLSLQLRESYADTLAGFVMQLRMRPTSLSFLNPVVAPLSSVNIVSGTVDSLYLNAIGREHMALGEMHLFYRNLRIKLVQFGDNRKPKALLAVVSFLANNLIIRKNNNGRKSLMYLERLRDRSVFNYIVKMTMSGIVSGVGIKNNKRILKRYHKDLERLQLPQFSNEARLEELVKEKEKR
jgi:hypothetical protein